MADPLEYRCVCCWSKVAKVEEGLPRVCRECFGKLSPADKATILTGMRQEELLRDIRGHLNILARNNENDENQLGSIARAFENFGRMIKLPAGKSTELINQVQAFFRLLQQQVEDAARNANNGRTRGGDDDDDEPWRESLRE